MGRSLRITSALVAGTLALVVGTPTAHAIFSTDQQKCLGAVAKEGGKYVAAKLKLYQKCNDANLAAPGACLAPDGDALTKIEGKLASGLAKKCSFDKLGPGFDDENLQSAGFPGPCPDVSGSGNGFTLSDLQSCIKTTHDQAFVGVCRGGLNLGEACTTVADCPDQTPGTTFCHGFLSTEYDPSLAGPITGDDLKCQKEFAKNSQKYAVTLQKSVAKCRTGTLTCKIVSTPTGDQTDCKVTSVDPRLCQTNEPKTKKAVDKARQKTLDTITGKCATANLATLKLCNPDQGTAAAAAQCTIDVHTALVDNTDAGDANDLIDYEYAQRGVCGDNRQNQISEECDGQADVSCPGDCGDALGFFPCLCQTIPRTRVVEHANADLDNGYTGKSHDSGIVEGGGYVTDLWDCDGPGGPDTECIVGPSCAAAPHQACNPTKNASGTAANADQICKTFNGPADFCRKSAGGATGPHCEIEFKKRCQTDNPSSCPLAGDRCIITPHGAPLPLSAGGVSVCVVNEFTEDVTGTTDLATGAGSIRLRQNSITYQGGDLQQPCPVCGGFCSGAGGSTDAGVRNLCTTNADCNVGAVCITAPLCSYGANIDQPCRTSAPAGGPTAFFGNPSVDCAVASETTQLGNINILFNPATTGMTTLTANTVCENVIGFSGKVCAGGPNQHVPCTNDTECPSGTCNFQCFCDNVNLPDQHPNACEPACLGGGNDGEPCGSNDDCASPGFCHPADCRLNVSDTDSAQEGACTTGPTDSTCSLQTWRVCDQDADCKPPSCPYCDPSEICVTNQQQCFVNPTIIRQGTPGLPTRVTAAIFCIAGAGAAVNSTAGLPGPGAITQPADTIEVGF